MRLIASLEHYLATESGDTLYIQQYTGSRLSGAGLDLEVTTDYPWSGAVYLRVLTAPQAGRGLALRVSAWSANTRILVNNDPERTVVSPGYHILHRRWQPGDVITVHLDVTPRWTYPDRRVDAVRGCVAIERGPLVYCFEQADQLGGARVDDLVIQPGGVLGERPVTLDGIGQTIEVTARASAWPRYRPPQLPRLRPPHPPPRSVQLFCLRGNCYRDPVFAVGQPRRRADAGLDAPGLGPDAVKVLEGELIQVLVGQAALGQRVHVGTGLADVAPGLAGGQRG